MMIVAKKMVGQKFFSPSSFGAVVGSRIQDPGRIKIRIRDKHLRSETLKNIQSQTHVS
jgi:hypothetical protein